MGNGVWGSSGQMLTYTDDHSFWHFGQSGEALSLACCIIAAAGIFGAHATGSAAPSRDYTRA
eukprot:scaffold11865_cov18-Prasinocladus_malaysianus.AAC.1